VAQHQSVSQTKQHNKLHSFKHKTFAQFQNDASYARNKNVTLRSNLELAAPWLWRGHFCATFSQASKNKTWHCRPNTASVSWHEGRQHLEQCGCEQHSCRHFGKSGFMLSFLGGGGDNNNYRSCRWCWYGRRCCRARSRRFWRLLNSRLFCTSARIRLFRTICFINFRSTPIHLRNRWLCPGWLIIRTKQPKKYKQAGHRGKHAMIAKCSMLVGSSVLSLYLLYKWPPQLRRIRSNS